MALCRRWLSVLGLEPPLFVSLSNSYGRNRWPGSFTTRKLCCLLVGSYSNPSFVSSLCLLGRRLSYAILPCRHDDLHSLLSCRRNQEFYWLCFIVFPTACLSVSAIDKYTEKRLFYRNGFQRSRTDTSCDSVLTFRVWEMNQIWVKSEKRIKCPASLVYTRQL